MKLDLGAYGQSPIGMNNKSAFDIFQKSELIYQEAHATVKALEDFFANLDSSQQPICVTLMEFKN
jgi:hypothetical protein